MILTQHFALDEMVVSQEAARRGIDNRPGAAALAELRRTAELLECVRALLQRPVIVSSGYRCPALNQAVGGTPGSAHVWGGAADIVVPGYGTPLAVARELARHAQSVDFDQLIHEFDAWVHVGRAPAGQAARHQVLTIDRAGARFGLGGA